MRGLGRLAAPYSLLLAAFAAGCSGGPWSIAPTTAQPAGILHADTATHIKHVVILIQENRSFDNFFATFPGADGATHGRRHDGTLVPLVKHSLLSPADFPHGYYSFLIDYDKGKMDGWDLSSGKYNAPLSPYQYVDPAQIAVYWTLAKHYVLADHMFTTQGSNSFTAHQDLIAGGTQINPNESIVDVPTESPWGCDAPAGTVTSLVDRAGIPAWNKGPFPCFKYPTVAGLLNRKHITWRSYATFPANDWNAFDAISSVRYGSQWTTNISTPQRTIFTDISNGTLPAVSWVTPSANYSDHPGMTHDYGPDWIGNIVNAVGASPYWKSTAIFIVWDDWGGLYDHVPPRRVGFGGLGFRVPAIVVSAYARAGFISHTEYQFGTILRFIEDNWRLGRLGTSDVRSNSIDGVFDFSHPPRAYVPVRVKHQRSFFMTLPLSTLPLDTD